MALGSKKRRLLAIVVGALHVAWNKSLATHGLQVRWRGV